MEQALENIKVLDLTRVLAGPYCTMQLGDLGADIIKVEMPEKGDDSRAFGPYVNGESAYFMTINRNKRSITLNLKTSKGKKILKELIAHVDVVVENFKPGTMERLELGYDVLKEINPKLIYASTSGFGYTGPYSNRPAYDGVVQAMGGIMSITGLESGEFTRVGPSIGDLAAGLFTTIGILGALNYRNTMGVGQKIDVAMLDCQVALLENAISRYFTNDKVPQPVGNRHASIVPFEPFETLDSKIMVAVGNERLWEKFCYALNCKELINDSRFKSNSLRVTYYSELKPLISRVMKKSTTKQWEAVLTEYGVPNSPINTVADVVENEQVLYRDMILEMDHPKAGKLKVPGVPIKMSKTQGNIRKTAPLLGEDTRDILSNILSYDDEDIDSFYEEGIL